MSTDTQTETPDGAEILREMVDEVGKMETERYPNLLKMGLAPQSCASPSNIRAIETLVDTLKSERDTATARVKYLEDRRARHTERMDDLITMFDQCAREALNLEAERDAALARVEELESALTPSSETKMRHWGEHEFVHLLPYHDVDNEDPDYSEEITVPWTTVKDIMKSISDHAALKEGE